MDFSKLGLRGMSNGDRLKTINELLALHKLRPLASLGDNTRGQPEIVDIDQWSNVNCKFFEDVFFVVRAPNGADYRHMVRFNANGAMSDGAVFAVVVNGKYVVLVRQFRTSLGVDTWELPRGFCDAVDLVAKHSGNPHSLGVAQLPKVVARELGEEVVRQAKVTALVSLGQFAENSGTHNVTPDCYQVHLNIPEELLAKFLGGSEGLALQLVTWQQIERGEEFPIVDMHSLALLALARRYRLLNQGK